MLAGSEDSVYAGPRVRVRRGRRAKLPVSKSVRRGWKGEGGRKVPMTRTSVSWRNAEW